MDTLTVIVTYSKLTACLLVLACSEQYWSSVRISVLFVIITDVVH